MDTKAQPKVQETSPEAPNESPKYTESQWREMQSKIRKAEAERIKMLQEKVSELESTKSTLESQIDSMSANEDIFKSTIAELHTQVEEGVPVDSKNIFNENQKLKVALREKEVRSKKDLERINVELSRFKDMERTQAAEKLSAKYGVDVEILKTFKDVDKMKAYALDNIDVTQLKPAEQPEVEADSPLLPKPSSPQIQPQGSGADRKFTEDEVKTMSLDTYTKNREQILRQFQEGSLK